MRVNRKIQVLLPAIALATSLLSFVACSSDSGDPIPTPGVAEPTAPIVTPALPPTPDRDFDRYTFEFVEAFGGHEWERPIDIAFLPDGDTALVASR